MIFTIFYSLLSFIKWIYQKLFGKSISNERNAKIITFIFLSFLLFLIIYLFSQLFNGCNKDNNIDNYPTNSINSLDNANKISQEKQIIKEIINDQILNVNKSLSDSNLAREEANRAIINANKISNSKTKNVNGSELDNKAKEYLKK